MVRRIFVVLVALFGLLCTGQISAQPTYSLRELVSTGNTAPVPPLLSDVVSFSFNDKGEVAYAGDGAVFLRSGQKVSMLANFGRPAPGGGTFTYADTLALNSAGQLVFRAGVTSPGTSGLFLFSKGKLSELIPDVVGKHTFDNVDQPQLNDNGDVAFTATLTDGTTAVFVAKAKTAHATGN